MTPEEALRDLFEISTDVRAAALIDASGAVVAAAPGTVPEGLAAAAAAFAAAAGEATATAAGGGTGAAAAGGAAAAAAGGAAPVCHAVVPTAAGVVAMVDEAGARAVALAGPRPAVPLLVFDLRACLRQAFAAGGETTEAPA